MDLPRCKVCQKPGSGVHYGVISCDACKAFFRRHVSSEDSLRCSSGRRCVRCRYRRCKQAGMSQMAIKRGRYSTVRKTKYILETRNESEWSSPQVESDVFTKSVLDAHQRHVPSFHYASCSLFSNLGTRAREYNDQDTSTSISDNLSNHRFQQTKEAIHQQMQSIIHPYINFLKAIPDSLGLSVLSQAKLLKDAFIEYFLLESYPGCQGESVVLCSSTPRCYHRDELAMIFGQELAKDVFAFYHVLTRLELSLTELVLVEAMCILSPDRCLLGDRQKVENLQWRIVSSLILHHKMSRHTSMSRFSKITDCVVAMRLLSDKYYQVLCAI